MQIFNFLVLSIISYHSVLTPHISKTHLPIYLMYVNSNWSDAQKPSQENGVPSAWEGGGGVETQLSPQTLKNY